MMMPAPMPNFSLLFTECPLLISNFPTLNSITPPMRLGFQVFRYSLPFRTGKGLSVPCPFQLSLIVYGRLEVEPESGIISGTPWLKFKSELIPAC